MVGTEEHCEWYEANPKVVGQSNPASVSAEPAHTVTSHPYVALSPTLYLSQATLPCLQVSPVPNSDTIEAKQLKDLQDLQEMDAAPSHTSPPSSILNK